ncbi:hypothetical protein ES703_38093 [subsurface metagenome]
MDYFKYFTKTAVINTTTHADGLTSSQEAPKRLKSILINITTHSGDRIQGWFEREKVFDIPDYCVDTQAVTATDVQPLSMNKINEIPVGVDMPVGSTFTVAVECGGVESTIHGAYRYEIIGA